MGLSYGYRMIMDNGKPIGIILAFPMDEGASLIKKACITDKTELHFIDYDADICTGTMKLCFRIIEKETKPE